MKIAIYCRKSRMSRGGESIENQIAMCKDYAKLHLNISEDDIVVYEDEGFTGKNTDRPNFKKLLYELQNGNIKALICYRLDRISRNVGDFSDILDTLTQNNVDFISIKENFDTTTPIGRAMMYISSVFAQLERETIAERIRDNYYKLAKTGRWLGGTPPLGFDSEIVNSMDIEGNKRSLYKLIPVVSELETVNLIFEKYLELGSLYKVEKYLIQESIKTKRGCYFSKTSLKSILNNPVYVVADSDLYDYISSVGCDISSSEADFTGKFGAIGYSKTLTTVNGKREKAEMSDWIIALGRHKGIISGKTWMRVQQILNLNKEKAPRSDTSDHALFANFLKCSKCGSSMRLTGNRINSKGITQFYYTCDLKSKSSGSLCDMPNANGIDFDITIVDYIKKTLADDSELGIVINDTKEKYGKNIFDLDEQIAHARKEIKRYSSMIDRLVNQLAMVDSDAPATHITDKITQFDNEIKKLNDRVDNYSKVKINIGKQSDNLSVIAQTHKEFLEAFDKQDIAVKRQMLRSIIESIVWDNNIIRIKLYSRLNDEIVNFSNDSGICINQNYTLVLLSNDVSGFLKQYRKYISLTQIKFANLCGLSESVVAKIETEPNVKISPKTIENISVTIFEEKLRKHFLRLIRENTSRG